MPKKTKKAATTQSDPVVELFAEVLWAADRVTALHKSDSIYGNEDGRQALKKLASVLARVTKVHNKLAQR